MSCLKYPPIALRILLSILIAAIAQLSAQAADVITLERAYDRTLATDQSIRIAFYEIKKAKLQTWSALTRIAPILTAGAGYSRDDTSTVASSTQLVQAAGTTIRELVQRNSTIQTGSASADVTLSQTLIDLSVFPAYKLGKLTIRSSHLARQYTIRETLFGVASAYYAVLDQHRLVAVSRITLELAKEELDLAQKRANVGEVTRADVLNAQVQVESARQTLIQDENTLEVDRNTLRNILNLPPDAPIELTDPPEYPTTLLPFETLLDRAYQHREDLQVKEVGILQDIQAKNVIWAAYAPKVSMSADAGLANVTTDQRYRSSNWDFDIAVNVPIFTGGQREINLANARYQIEEDKLTRDQAAKGVEADVKQAWLNVRTLEQTLKAARIQVAAAAQSYEDLKHQYAAGVATSVDVLTALNNLDTARKNLTVQTDAYQVGLRNIEEVTGVFQEQRVRSAHVK